MSRDIIDGYHFLVSIAPETKAANLDAYKETTTNTTAWMIIIRKFLIPIPLEITRV